MKCVQNYVTKTCQYLYFCSLCAVPPPSVVNNIGLIVGPVCAAVLVIVTVLLVIVVVICTMSRMRKPAQQEMVVTQQVRITMLTASSIMPIEFPVHSMRTGSCAHC